MPVYQQSSRNVRGSGWHKKGYRDHGCMWLNVRRAYCVGPFTRGADFNESLTMGEFLQRVVRDISSEEGFQLPGRRRIDVQRYRKSLFDEPMEALITDYFDGGEGLSVKVYDEDDREILLDFSGPGSQWVYK